MSAAERYEIRIQGPADPAWFDWYEAEIVQQAGGVTVLKAELVDQAALHGLLERIRDLNLVLLAVNRSEREQP